jgi:hypothetical protein
MDERHLYVKTDWESWGAVMANDGGESFDTIMGLIFKFANETSTRVPLTGVCVCVCVSVCVCVCVCVCVSVSVCDV